MAIATIVNRTTSMRSGKGRPSSSPHGYGCDQSVCRHVASAFPDHRVILFDPVGAGKSDLTA